MLPQAASAAMQVLGHWDNGPTFDIVTNGNYLYLAAGEQVRIYDLSTKDKLQNLAWEQTTSLSTRPEFGAYREKNPPINIIHTGGLISSLYAEGNYLYITNDKYFLVADISNPMNGLIISKLNLANNNDVKTHGNYAYVASSDAWTGGIRIIDISNKANPSLVKTYILSGRNQPWRLDISGNYLYAALKQDATLEILDISNPTNPLTVGAYANATRVDSSYSSVAVRGVYAYVVEYHEGIRIIDVSNPANPVEVNRIIGAPGQYNYADIKLLGSYAFTSVRYGGIDVIDISNPLTAAIMGHGIDPSGPYAEGVFPVSLSYGTYAFLAGDTSGAVIFDVADAANPAFQTRIWVNQGGDSIAMKGKYAYIAGHNDGVWTIDVSDPENPKDVAFTYFGGRHTGATIQGDYLYTAGAWNRLSIVNIADPLNPKVVATGIGTNNLNANLVADGAYLYSGDGFDGYIWINGTRINPNNFVIYDITDPEMTTEVFKKDLGFGFASFVSEKYGSNYLLAGGANGLFIVDISNRLNPVVAGNYGSLNLEYGDIRAVGTVAYATGADYLYAFDISDVSHPLLLGKIYVNGATGLAIYGNVAYVFPRFESYGFDAVNISDPRNMKIINTLAIAGDGYAARIVELDGLLYTNSGYIISPEPAPPAISAIIVDNITSRRATITWDTNFMSDSLVKYGTSPGTYTSQNYNPIQTKKQHIITVTGLSPSMTYYFVAKSSDLSGNTTQTIENTFTTLPPDVTPPVITIVSPGNNANVLGGVQQIAVNISTNEYASCQYSTADFVYGDGTNMLSADAINHYFGPNTQDGNTYTFYYRCMDDSGNKNTVSTMHSFTQPAEWWDYFDSSSNTPVLSGTKVQGGETILDIPSYKVSLTKDNELYQPNPDSNYKGGDLVVGNWDRERTLLSAVLPAGSGNINSLKIFMYRYTGVSTDSGIPLTDTINIHSLTGTFSESEAT